MYFIILTQARRQPRPMKKTSVSKGMKSLHINMTEPKTWKKLPIRMIIDQ